MIMGASAVFDVVLALGVLGAAAFALFGRKRIHAAAMFLVFGVLLSVVWAWLKAPDVAIAEAVLGAGVTGVLIMNAVTAAPEPPENQSGEDVANQARSGQASSSQASSGQARSSRRWPGRRWYGLVSGGLAAMVAFGLLAAVWQWQVVTGVGAVVEGQMDASGVDHPVTAVLLNFRSYDTLLEIAVLAAAALGGLALRPSGPLVSAAPTPDRGPLAALVRVVVPILVLLLGWLLVAGSTRPGGAFQAGALFTGAILMIYLAGIGTGRLPGTNATRRVQRWVRPALLAGLAAFLLLAGVTALMGGGWLVLEESWAGPVILGLEAVLLVSIGCTLAVLLVVMDRITAEGAGRLDHSGHGYAPGNGVGRGHGRGRADQHGRGDGDRDAG